MGGTLSSSAKQLAQRVAPGGARKLKPFSPEEIDALNRIAEQDQARLRALPSLDELNAKDSTLDNFLSKLGGAIEGRDLSPDEPPPQASTSGRSPAVQMPPARPPQAVRTAQVAVRKSLASADDQPGRLHSYIIREILEGRTAASAQQKELDLEPYVSTYGADRVKLLLLMEHNCLPAVGKVATFGHQYAFARAPQWWLREGLSGSKYLSEPDELRKRLMGNPVGSSGGDGAAGIFGGGRALRNRGTQPQGSGPGRAAAGVGTEGASGRGQST